MPGTATGAASPAGRDILLVEDLSQQRLPARAIAAVLRQAGFGAHVAHYGPVCCDDCDAVRTIAALAERLHPRLVILSILFANRVQEYLALAEALREAGVRTHVTIAGPLPSFAAAELLAACPALDSVLCGEAEATAAELAAQLDDPAQRPTVRGLAYHAPDGSIQQRGEWPPLVEDLDSLPFPVHDDELPSYLGHRFATVEGSRGCYHACSFCLPSAFYRTATGHGKVESVRQVLREDSRDGVGNATTEVVATVRKAGGAGDRCYRLRSVGNLVDEIAALYRRGARLFLFDDEQFLPPPPFREARIAQLEQELARRDLKIAFTIKCRADDVEARLFRRLREMGLLRVYVGVESGCQESLDLLGKGVSAERNLEALATLDELGIVADFYDLLFHPWSTLEFIERDVAFCRRAASHLSTLLKFYDLGVLPGTELAGRLLAEGRRRGEPWSYGYELVDPRAEVLHRLSRFVFTASRSPLRLEQLLTQAWYAIRLEQRFPSAQLIKVPDARLREVAAHVNRDRLEIWSEMLEFARTGPIRDAERVNDAAGRWAARVNASCMHAASTLADLGLPRGAYSEAEVAPLC